MNTTRNYDIEPIRYRLESYYSNKGDLSTSERANAVTTTVFKSLTKKQPKND